jgi:hypothetical protein
MALALEDRAVPLESGHAESDRQQTTMRTTPRTMATYNLCAVDVASLG